MKILQIPLRTEMKYGETERIVLDLGLEYMKKEHESVVIASGNSVINNNFEAHCANCLEVIASENPDVVHDHTNLITSKAYRESGIDIPLLTTLHGDLNDHGLPKLCKIKKIRKNGVNFFSAMSESQRSIFHPRLAIDFVVYNGINTKEYPFENKKEEYLLSIGKRDRNKAQDTAIKVAKNLGEKLVIMEPFHVFNSWIREPWEYEIEPQIEEAHYSIPAKKIKGFINDFLESDKKIIYVGEINDEQKKEWLKYSKGLLMPRKWREPFEFIMMESMACGAPIVAYNLGAVPEIISDGRTGYVVAEGDFKGFLDATKSLGAIDPYECRERAENFFDISRQAMDYIGVFNKII